MYLRIVLLLLVVWHVNAHAPKKGRKKPSTEESTDESTDENDSDDESYDSSDYTYETDEDADDDDEEDASSDYESGSVIRNRTKSGVAKRRPTGTVQYRKLNTTGDTSEDREYALKAYKEHMKDLGFPSNYDERRINMQLHPENYEEEEEYELTEEYVETTSTTTTEATTTRKPRRRRPTRRALTLPTGKLRRGRRLKRQAEIYKNGAASSLIDFFGFNRFKEWMMKSRSLKLTMVNKKREERLKNVLRYGTI